jgi:hypothetical protein
MLGGRQKREASEQRNMGWGGWATLETPRVCAGRGVDRGRVPWTAIRRAWVLAPAPAQIYIAV